MRDQSNDLPWHSLDQLQQTMHVAEVVVPRTVECDDGAKQVSARVLVDAAALDALWAKDASHLGTIVRYADDGVVLCRTEANAQAA